MAIQSLDTTVKTVTNRLGDGAYYFTNASATTTTATAYIPAPVKGKVARVVFSNGSTVMAAANNYKVGITNAGNSAAVICDSTDNGANDFGGTAYTGAFLAAQGKKDCTLSATAANLNVAEGDILVVVLTVEGTVAYGAVTVQFEAIP